MGRKGKGEQRKKELGILPVFRVRRIGFATSSASSSVSPLAPNRRSSGGRGRGVRERVVEVGFGGSGGGLLEGNKCLL